MPQRTVEWCSLLLSGLRFRGDWLDWAGRNVWWCVFMCVHGWVVCVFFKTEVISYFVWNMS